MYKNILIPVSLDQERNTPLALQAAQTLLSAGGKLTAVYVDEPIPTFATSYLPNGYEEERRLGLGDGLKEAVKDIDGIETAVLFGSPGQKIVEYAREHKVDCIVVASHQHGLTDYFLGSTAARVVRHADCAVHVVR